MEEVKDLFDCEDVLGSGCGLIEGAEGSLPYTVYSKSNFSQTLGSQGEIQFLRGELCTTGESSCTA